MSSSPPNPTPRESRSITIKNGDLQVAFVDNGLPPKLIGGVSSLVHLRDAPNISAFNPTCDFGLNFEHITSGHRSPYNQYAPRIIPYLVSQLDASSVQMVWEHQYSPWALASRIKFTVVAPHYIDMDCQFLPLDKYVFGSRGYAMLFFCNYMSNVEDSALHFCGIDRPNQDERWIRADGSRGHPDWNYGGTYRSQHASDLECDLDHDLRMNIWSYDYPRFTKPFYFGKAHSGMVLMLMFNKMLSHEDEIRFSLFDFSESKQKDPAWDFQYIIHKIEAQRIYGFKARLVWKKFISPEDCLKEYETWAASNLYSS